MKKLYHPTKNVYEATIERLEYIFSEFDNVYVAFSGGKDSGLLLHLCLRYMKERGINKKLGVYHMDYECQYQATTDFTKFMEDKYKDDIDLYHTCMPIKAQNCVSIGQGYWRPWNPAERELWVRKLPENSLNCDNNPFGEYYDETMSDYDFNMSFAAWYGKQKGGKTICLTGIRTNESFDRYMRIVTKERKYKNIGYIYQLKNGTYNGYPIYDWTVDDVWIAHAKFGFEYNKLYDLFHYAGLTPDQMRVASPFNNYAHASLKLYKAIDPKTWGKMLSRVNGVSFAGIYGDTTAMGWRSITKPKHFTWEQYLKFLLSTMDEKTRYNYETRFATSIEFWREKGGVIDDKTLQQLRDCGIKFTEKPRHTKISNRNVVLFDTYPDDTDVDNFHGVPSFKRMCVCILKNDWYCKYMGFIPTKKEQSQRKKAMEKYGRWNKRGKG